MFGPRKSPEVVAGCEGGIAGAASGTPPRGLSLGRIGAARVHGLALEDLMMKKSWVHALVMASALLGAVVVGCHADADDPAGQAGELTDPVRRNNAVTNIARLYSGALERASGDRNAEPAAGVRNATIVQLNDCYMQNGAIDPGTGLQMLSILSDMRDVRSLPSLTKALDWRPEISEEHAITAARTLQHIELDEAQKGEVITALSAALSRVSQARGVDNRMRIEFTRALGRTHDARATPALAEVALRQSENQSFLINRVAAEELARSGDPAAIPTFIRALYIFAPNQPAMRMQDLGAQGLVRIGRASLQPLLDTLAGNNVEANQLATQLIATIRQQGPAGAAAAEQMSVESLVAGEASLALGQLGFREAIDPLIRETQQLDEGERADSAETDETDKYRINSAIFALCEIPREESDNERVRAAVLAAYARLTDSALRQQLTVNFQHLGDPALIPFFLQTAQRPSRTDAGDEVLRAFALGAAMLIANNTEIAPARAIYEAESGSDLRAVLAENSLGGDVEPLLAATAECDADLACWTRKLGDSNVTVARKAAYMVARYGRGNAEAIQALIGQVGHREIAVRLDVLHALDAIAVDGSPAAVARIEELKTAEEGRAIWNRTGQNAMAVAARLTARQAH